MDLFVVPTIGFDLLLAGAKRVGKVVRLQRTNPFDPIKAELLGRLREHYAAEGAS